ncbi:SusC/RagA family TonB-linked outer membrane protein [Sphingobacterium cellulitidis]|uniref:SusC/RagA family TonB-linked outer membrane protein n=1 Tax=Sphingobacterium cellulitidis TaxID=1768011 RepID=UPI003C7CC187
MRRLLLFSLALGLTMPTYASFNANKGVVALGNHAGWTKATSVLQNTVSGTVSGPDGPLAGVTVSVVGSSVTTVTDSKGKFTITASVGSTLRISFVGFQTKEVPVTGNTVNVSLESSEDIIDEVVVVGYGTQKRSNVTGAVSSVDVEKTFKTRPITDVGKALQGSVPGLTITSPSGDLGSNPTIRLRGVTGSLNAGSASPLILVDNVEVPNLQMVNPEDIASVSVLKDAASTSVYGTRAAWGVILITTKTGRKDTPNQLSYSNNFAWQRPTEVLDIADAADGAEVALKALQRTNPNTDVFGAVGVYYDQLAIEKMREWESMYGGQDLGSEMVEGRDWEVRGGRLFFYRPWDAPGMYMKDYAPQQTHNLNMNGGSSTISYNLGLGYINQGGVLKVNPDKFTRYNVNGSVDAKINKWISARSKFLYSNTLKTSPYSFGGGTYDPWFYLYRWQKVFPYGTIDGNPMRNSITEVEQAKMNEYKMGMTRINLGATVNIIDGLTFDADYTYTNWGARDHIVGGSVKGIDFWAGGGEMPYRTFTSASHDRVNYTSYYQDRQVFNGFFNYNKAFGDHDLKFTLGMNMEMYEGGNHYSEKTMLMDPDKGELALATGVQTAGSTLGDWATLGYIGRINYAYKNKYLFQVSGRQDGSSRFPSSNRWAFFPAVSAGWVVTEENFMQELKPYLSFLKFRGSYGMIGNQNVGANAFISTMPSTSSGWLVGDAFQYTVGTPNVVSPILTWEKVTDLDIGADAGFFNDRLNVTFDWFKRTTSDMLSSGSTLPSSFGATPPRVNYGAMETKGWETEVKFRHTFDNGLFFSVGGQLSDFKERITKFNNATRLISSNYEGRVIGEIWGYETDRFFTKDDFQQDASGNLLKDNAGKWILNEGIADQKDFESGWFFYGPGDIKYKDLNNDGKISTGDGSVENPGDRKIIGNSNPRWQYGFRLDMEYKGFDLGVFFQGVGKREQWASGTVFIPGFRPGEAWYQHQLDYWTEENPNAFYPRPTDQGQSNSIRNFMPQTKYLMDMSYLRLKNLTFGYTLPKNFVEKAKLSRVRVFFSGENLFEKKNTNIPIDPETDYTSWGLNDGNSFGRVYPFKRSYSFGVQVGL